MTTDAMTPQDVTLHWELSRLNNAFVYFMDNGEFDSMIRLFTSDAVFDRAGIVHHGHEEMRQGMRDRPKVTTRHLLTNFYLTKADDDSAEAVVCAMVYHGPLANDGERWSTPLTTDESSSFTTRTPKPRRDGASRHGSRARSSLPRYGRDRQDNGSESHG